MAWVETASLSFIARHDSAQADAAAGVLDDLEAFRARLEGAVRERAWRGSVVIHPRPLMLAVAAPWLPARTAVSAPAGRRYFARVVLAAARSTCLPPRRWRSARPGVPGSREALLRSPRHEYAHVVIGAANPALPPPVLAGQLPPVRARGLAVRGRRAPTWRARCPTCAPR